MSESKAAKAAAKVLRQSNNEWSNKYFAIAMGSIMIIFALYHWSSVIFSRSFKGADHSQFTRMYRKARRLMSTQRSGLRLDRSLLYIVYWAVNLILAVTNVDLTELSYVGKRFGWISLANLVLLVFLSLKNTPLAPLTAKSYEKLRPLHKVAGYTCIFTSCLHAIVYLSAWGQTGKLMNMTERKNFSGAIAGMAMLIIALSTISFLMRNAYEIFYTIHVLMFILIMITVGMHRPDFSASAVIITIFTACLWGMDRIIRSAKLGWNFFGNTATITALPDNAVRVRLKRRIPSRPGSHAFLWLPKIRLAETHPFTLLSPHSPEFVIRVYDGFTSDVYKAALEAPGRSLRCSVDGPYGQVPDFGLYENVILVAGGSGASFTFAIALDLIEKAASSANNKMINFIWVVRFEETLDWFSQELDQLESHPNVNVMIYVTRGSSELPDTPSETLPEKVSANVNTAVADSAVLSNTARDPEKSPLPDLASQKRPLRDFQRGRPNIGQLISTAISSPSTNSVDVGRVIVGACGPTELVDSTRQAALHEKHDNGPAMTIYTEEFGW